MEPYTTQDLDLVITLKTLGFRWTKVTSSKGKLTVIFEHSPQLETTINKFHLGELRVEPSDLLLAYRAMRKMVREVGREVANG